MLLANPGTCVTGACAWVTPRPCRSAPARPCRPRSGGFDFDHPRRRGARRGDSHLEHAVHARGLHSGDVDALGERDASLERAVRDLTDEVLLARGVVIGLPLSLDGERVVHHGHLDCLRIHARQGELDDVGAVLESPLRGGEPRRDGRSGRIRGVVDEPRKQILDVVVMEMELLGERRPMHHGGHGAVLSFYPGEHRQDLLPRNQYTTYFPYRFYFMIYTDTGRRSRGLPKGGVRSGHFTSCDGHPHQLEEAPAPWRRQGG